MNPTLNSIYLLFKILWHISNTRKKFSTLFVLIFSIFSSLLQYINILITAFAFSFITSLVYSQGASIDFDLIFGQIIELNSNSFPKIIFIWLLSAIVSYLSSMLSTFLLYKISYSFGEKLSAKLLNISINSNSFYFEDISEKTLFNLITVENTLLIKGSIFALINLPMQVVTTISLIAIIIKYSYVLFISLPLIALIYFLISNFIYNSVSKKGKLIFDLRSFQTDILGRIIENYLDVKFPPSDKAYKKLFNQTTSKLRNLESLIAIIPKVLKSFLELIILLMIGIYIFYNIAILNIPIETFVSYSAAVILALFKLLPILSGFSSNFLSFNSQYEIIKRYTNLIFKSDKYNLFKNKEIYSKVQLGKFYELSFKKVISERIMKSNKKNISFTMKDKKLLWITGKSGCGKSTFLSMVAGIRPITKGEIILSINRKNLPNVFIHKNIAYMPQNPIFHSITVLEYIVDGDPITNNLKIKKILNQLDIPGSFGMNKENILNLIIGPRGYTPSGGQAKLLAFARALYKKDVYLYLFDEPTSDLSSELKDIILERIYLLSKLKFVLCITHDLNAIRSEDQRLNL